MKKLSVLFLLLISYVSCFAQNKDVPEMADVMYKEGRIYVVIATIVIVFAGLSVYLFSIDRRLRKIEKEK